MSNEGSRRRVSASQAGFTLLEILVAFMILALGVGAILQAPGTGLRRESAAERQLQAGAIAEGLIARIGHEIPVREGLLSGESGGYLWESSITAMEEPTPAALPEPKQAQAQQAKFASAQSQLTAPGVSPVRSYA